jgi:hypothetical protein
LSLLHHRAEPLADLPAVVALAVAVEVKEGRVGAAPRPTTSFRSREWAAPKLSVQMTRTV